MDSKRLTIWCTAFVLVIIGTCLSDMSQKEDAFKDRLRWALKKQEKELTTMGKSKITIKPQMIEIHTQNDKYEKNYKITFDNEGNVQNNGVCWR